MTGTIDFNAKVVKYYISKEEAEWIDKVINTIISYTRSDDTTEEDMYASMVYPMATYLMCVIYIHREPSHDLHASEFAHEVIWPEGYDSELYEKKVKEIKMWDMIVNAGEYYLSKLKEGSSSLTKSELDFTKLFKYYPFDGEVYFNPNIPM